MDQQIVGGNHEAGILSGEQHKDIDQIYMGGEAQANQHIVDKEHSSDHSLNTTQTLTKRINILEFQANKGSY
eukprot:5203971-Heterocapsa_arctica.AAC.1